jgi:hypothetical protein
MRRGRAIVRLPRDDGHRPLLRERLLLHLPVTRAIAALIVYDTDAPSRRPMP